MERLSQKYAEYGQAKDGGGRCSECRWYESGACQVVEGTIARGGWCRFWHGGRAVAAGRREQSADYVRQMRSR